MRPAALLTLVGALLSISAQAQLPGERHDEIDVVPQPSSLSLRWSDADDDLKGSITPIPLREGSPLEVSLRIAPFYGEPFEGPVTLSLRSKDGTHREEHTVTRGETAWTARFVPKTDGAHVLDVTFRTTHLKVLHADLLVEPLPVPRYIGWGLVAILAVAILAFAVWRLLRRPK